MKYRTTIQEMHTLAEQNMRQSGPAGDAWCYVYEVTSNITASRAHVSTRLLRAANDPRIDPFKRRIYQTCADDLAYIEEEPTLDPTLLTQFQAYRRTSIPL